MVHKCVNYANATLLKFANSESGEKEGDRMGAGVCKMGQKSASGP